MRIVAQACLVVRLLALQSVMGSASSRRLQVTADSTCVDGDVDLSFHKANVIHNNLGNIGPDSGEENIVFGNVGEYLGESINLVLSIKPGAEYVPTDLDRNGMICTSARRSCEEGGDFGQVNLKSNHETTLLFQFQSGATGEPVVLPGFLFSGLDIDGQLLEETYVIKGWDTAFYDRENTEAYFSEDEEGYCDDGQSCLYAHSTSLGSVCDNPLDAFDLGMITCANRTVNQKVRAFMLSFSNKSEFEVFFKATRPARDYGRNFVFAFASSWAEGCMLLPTVPPTVAPIAPTTAMPTNIPTLAPTNAPTDAPTGGPTSKPTVSPTKGPTGGPTMVPTKGPTGGPTMSPTEEPTSEPTMAATVAATMVATSTPTMGPTDTPTLPPVTASPAVVGVPASGKSGKSGGKSGTGKGDSGKSGGKSGTGKGDSGKSGGKSGTGKGDSDEIGSGKGGDAKSSGGKGGDGKGTSGSKSMIKSGKGGKSMKKKKSTTSTSIRGMKLAKQMSAETESGS